MEKPRVLYFDILNIFAAFSVICMHCNGIVHTYTDTFAWKQALVVECVCYWAVPIFLMLSGANLMNYREKYTTKTFFKKRFFRAVIPFLVWSLIVAAEKQINPFEIGFKAFLNQIILGKIENVYWFFPPLFGLYIAMPVLSLLKDNKKILWYMAGGATLLNTVIPSVLSSVGISWNGSFSMMLASGILLFPIIGFLFATTEFKKWHRMIIYTLGIFALLLRYFGTWYLSASAGELNRKFFGYYEYFSIFLACAVFTFAKYFKPFAQLSASPKAKKVLSTISGCSLGIYLVHMIVIRKLGHVIPSNNWEWRILVPFLVYAISLAVVYLLKKIPILKHIVP